MKKFIAEFKEFAMKGNVVDMAIGVVIGAAFGKITTSLVNDVIMPLISRITGGVDFSAWKWVLKAAETAADGTEIPAGLPDHRAGAVHGGQGHQQAAQHRQEAGGARGGGSPRAHQRGAADGDPRPAEG